MRVPSQDDHLPRRRRLQPQLPLGPHRVRGWGREPRRRGAQGVETEQQRNVAPDEGGVGGGVEARLRAAAEGPVLDPTDIAAFSPEAGGEERDPGELAAWGYVQILCQLRLVACYLLVLCMWSVSICACVA